jgi:Domain of unknown function (DUF4129)
VRLRPERLGCRARGLNLGLTLSLAGSLAWGLASSAGAAAAGTPVSPAAANAAPIGTYLTREEIRAAAAKLRADPNLGGERTLRTLRWNETSQARGTPPPRWLTRLFDVFAQSWSLLLWIIGALCAALAVVWAIRVLRERMPAAAVEQPTVTTVQGLDIRPESLPDNIGAAALELLEAGREREALSLLYRGALSRAVHRYGVTILPSATEGEALRAVNATLDPPRAAYFADLITLWQRAVYAGERVMREPIARLCRGFAASLEGSAP